MQWLVLTIRIEGTLSYFYTPLRRRRGYKILAMSLSPSICFPSVIPFVLLSVRNQTFHGFFLSNHASQPLQTWYGASSRDPTLGLPNSCPPVNYFLFSKNNMVHCQILVALYGDLLSSYSQIFCS